MANVIFEFKFQYNYSNHKASFIDGLIAISTLLVITAAVTIVLRAVVRNSFLGELKKEIFRIDEAV